MIQDIPVIKKELMSSLRTMKLRQRADLDCLKRKIARQTNQPCLKNSQLLKIYHELVKNKSIKKNADLESLLIKRPIRSLSGIVNVSVLTKPYPCPGKCIFCPSQKNIPKSYLAKEPAVQRALFHKFNAFNQVTGRLQALKETGHPINKVELRIIGGTWSYYPTAYQQNFITDCFFACNSFGRKNIRKKSSLLKEQKLNETSRCRIVGLAVETRPDYITVEEIKRMRDLGITKVELGVQTTNDQILKLNQRGHNTAAITQATKLLKDAGFKVSYQMMPGLFGATAEQDLQVFQQLFNDENFKPDFLKIYPLALVKNTKLYQHYQKGNYQPYTKDELLQLLTSIKLHVPNWCRIERVIRDIPSEEIVEGGTKVLNLREEVFKELKKQGASCRCIRCREVQNNADPKEEIQLFQECYLASGGREFFLSFENQERSKLYALLRLRLPLNSSNALLKYFPALKGSALIRELHTFGPALAFNQRAPRANQHQGLGQKLMTEAEKITQKSGYTKVAIISAVGVRGYYRKLGYKQKETYMVKSLRKKGG